MFQLLEMYYEFLFLRSYLWNSAIDITKKGLIVINKIFEGKALEVQVPRKAPILHCDSSILVLSSTH